MAYRGPFDGFHATEVAVSKTCLVRFDNNQYSVAARAVGRPVDVRAYADRIVIRQDGEIVAEHPRGFGRGRFVYDPWHYVPVLTKKPGRAAQWRALQGLAVAQRARSPADPAVCPRRRRPAVSSRFSRRCWRTGWRRSRRPAPRRLPAAPAAPTSVLNILARQREPAPPASIPTPEGLPASPPAGGRLSALRPPEGGPAMERHEVLAMMTKLKLAGMRTAYDDILADGLKRRHPVQQIIGALLKAEIADKTARSIKYQMASAKLPAARELAEFDFAASPVNEPLIRDLAMGGFFEAKRNIVLVGGTGTGKTHLAVAIARSCIRKGARGRFYNVVDLVNLLEAELRSGRQGRTADQLTRRDFVILDETRIPALRPGRRAAALPPDEPALRAHLDRHHHQPRLRRMAVRPSATPR